MLSTTNDAPLLQIARAAVAIEDATGFPTAALISQWACESSWGKKITGDFNYWGKIRDPEAGPARFCATHEDVSLAELAKFRPDERASETKRQPLGNGRFRIWLSRWFANYKTLEESLRDYVATFIKSPQRYKPAWQQYQQDKNVDAFLIAVCKAGYATASDYPHTLLAIAHQSNVQQAISAARSELMHSKAAPSQAA
jgi:flagellum-specific peptidoglycan hydrolase FlgJ